MKDKVVLYTGRRGAGKTLTMVTEAFLYWKNGVDVYTNFHCKFGKRLSSRHIYNLHKYDIKNSVICIDELHLFFDSRKFMANTNIEFSQFLAKLRKNKIIIMGTVQFKDNTEYRFRQHCDVECSMVTRPDLQIVEAVYLDKTKIQEGIFDSTSEFFKEILNEKKTKPYKKVIYDVSDVFKYNLYDTNEDPTKN